MTKKGAICSMMAFELIKKKMVGSTQTALPQQEAETKQDMKPEAEQESGLIRLTDYITQAPLTRIDRTCGDVQKLFRARAESECILVCDDNDIPLGLVMRDRFYMNISKRFGVELYYDRPIHTLMDMSMTIADVLLSPQQVLEMAMLRAGRQQYDCIVITEHNKAIGVLTVADLLRMSRELQREAVVTVTDRVKFELAHNEAAMNEVRVSALQGNDISESMSELAALGKSGLGKVSDSFGRLAARSASQEAAMKGLEREVEQVMAASAAITQLAEQSRMLALNAAIEAARAGQYGKGFSVVAEEVKKLANETQRTAELIRSEIAGISLTISQTAELAREGREESETSAGHVEEAVHVFSRLYQAADDNRSSAEAIGRLSESAYKHSLKAAEQLSELLG